MGKIHAYMHPVVYKWVPDYCCVTEYPSPSHIPPSTPGLEEIIISLETPALSPS